MTEKKLIVHLISLTLIWVGWGNSPSPLPLCCFFSLNNSETVKAVTLAFSIFSIQLHFIRDIRAKFGVPNSPQSPDIQQNSNGDICHFRIFGQSFIKENCHNSRTGTDIDMKLGPVTKFDKRNTLVMTSCRQVMTSLSIFWLMANLEQSGSQIPDTSYVKLTFSLTVIFYLTKSENRSKNL